MLFVSICFLYSHYFSLYITSGDNIEITSVNRPEGRIFDWLYEPMSIMKEQIRRLNLQESEELYLYKLCLYSGDMTRVESWHNGGVPPPDEIRRAQLEGLSRRYCESNSFMLLDFKFYRTHLITFLLIVLKGYAYLLTFFFVLYSTFKIILEIIANPNN